MDPRLLKAYNEELLYLREGAKLFGEEHPTVAGRLGLGSASDVDPHVERLLEGVAFLGARVQLKISDQFPEFTQHLLNAVQPHLLAPTPSICIAGFEPRKGERGLEQGVTVPRSTALDGVAADRDGTPVAFRTGHDVTLWPIRVIQLEYLGSRAAVAPFLGSGTFDGPIEAGLRIRLRADAGIPLRSLALDSLPLYLAGEGVVPGELYRQLVGDAAAAYASVPSLQGLRVQLPLPAQHGFDDESSLLPIHRRSGRGYRILAEYFACPERFRFIRLDGLARAFSEMASAEECDIVILLRRSVPTLVGALSPSTVRLFATPAVNLIERQLDRVQIDGFDHERQVVPDRVRPSDFEVYRLLDVRAHGRGSVEGHAVSALHHGALQLEHPSSAMFYVARLRPRRMSTREQRARGRADYVGTETWISLTTPGEPQRLQDVRELSIRALVTNRELAGSLRESDRPLSAEGLPVRTIDLVRAPTKPRPPLAVGGEAWRVVEHLTPNYTGFAGDPDGSPDLLKGHLALYVPAGDLAARGEIEALRSVTATPASRRLVDRNRPIFVRGQHLRIVLDESSFESGRMFLFASVLERFLAEFAAINSFVEVSFESLQQGVFAQWPARLGQRPTI